MELKHERSREQMLKDVFSVAGAVKQFYFYESLYFFFQKHYEHIYCE